MAVNDEVLVLGLIRFSVVSRKNTGNWRQTRGQTLDDTLQVIFDPERLERRFRLFEHITLPCLRAEAQQSEPGEVAILASTLMPTPWRDRLRDLVAGITGVKVCELDAERPLAERVSRIVRARTQPHHRLVVTYRLDDDDALAVGFTSTLRALANEDSFGSIVSHRHGVSLSRDAASDLLAVTETEEVGNSCGIAYINRPDDRGYIFTCGSHTGLAETYPIVLAQQPKAWIRVLHGAADTCGGSGQGSRQKLTPVQAARWLGDGYAYLDMEQVAQAIAFSSREKATVGD